MLSAVLQGLLYLIGLRSLGVPHGISELNAFHRSSQWELQETFFVLAALPLDSQTHAVQASAIVTGIVFQDHAHVAPCGSLADHAQSLEAIFTQAVLHGRNHTRIWPATAMAQVTWLWSFLHNHDPRRGIGSTDLERIPVHATQDQPVLVQQAPMDPRLSQGSLRFDKGLLKCLFKRLFKCLLKVFKRPFKSLLKAFSRPFQEKIGILAWRITIQAKSLASITGASGAPGP